MIRLLLAILILFLLPGLWESYWLLGLSIMLLICFSLLNWLWLWAATRKTILGRIMPQQAFQGDVLDIELTAHNSSRLPLPWLHIYDYVPTGLNASPRPEWIVTVRGQEKIHLHYKLECRKRGRYHIGPVEGQAGVILEVGSDPAGKRLNWVARSRLTVYPKIVPLEQLQLPSRLPLGNLRTRQPLLPDPSRIAGVREYQPGDDPRYVDWRNTARVGELLVKQFERSRVVPMAVFLDLHPPNMSFSWRQAAEKSIIVAASLVARANELKQAFGLYSNGYDPGWDERNHWNEVVRPDMRPPGDGRPEMHPRSGSAWLYEILDKLAGIDLEAKGLRLDQLAGGWTNTLPWGATIALVGFEPYPELLTEFMRLRKAGFTVMGIFSGQGQYSKEGESGLYALRSSGFAIYDIKYPGELNLTKRS